MQTSFDKTWLPRIKLIPAILAYAGLALMVLGALSAPWYVYETITMVPTNTWLDTGPGFIAFIGVSLAGIAALLALFGAIISEMISRASNIWVFMIVAGLASLVSISASYYYMLVTDNPHLHIGGKELLFGLAFELPIIACVITGVTIGLRRKPKNKLDFTSFSSSQ
jgi:hypothetical protein